jgi:hypothetical protein
MKKLKFLNESFKMETFRKGVVVFPRKTSKYHVVFCLFSLILNFVPLFQPMDAFHERPQIFQEKALQTKEALKLLKSFQRPKKFKNSKNNF